MNLGVVYRFCEMMDERIKDPRLASRHLVYYTDENPRVRSNTAFLLAAYMVCVHGWTAGKIAACSYAERERERGTLCYARERYAMLRLLRVAMQHSLALK